MFSSGFTWAFFNDGLYLNVIDETQASNAITIFKVPLLYHLSHFGVDLAINWSSASGFSRFTFICFLNLNRDIVRIPHIVGSIADGCKNCEKNQY